ncbi:MAG: hypothetical protein RLY93_19500 [Sumerlaeia bacterium]
MNSLRNPLLLILIWSLLPPPLTAQEEPAPQTVRLALSSAQDAIRTRLVLVDPDEDIVLRAEALEPSGADPIADQVPVAGPAKIFVRSQTDLAWNVSAGRAAPISSQEILWRSTKPGQYALVQAESRRALRLATEGSNDLLDATGESESTQRARVALLAGIPFDRDGPGTIGAYVVGFYPNEDGPQAPAPVQRMPEIYRPPSVFYPAHGEPAELPLAVTPTGQALTLAFFNPPVFPAEGERYVAFDQRLVDFWLALRGIAFQNDKDPDALRVLRGYVSPAERQRLGRQDVRLATFTRYQYGDALAVILDENGDFILDDLDGDGETAAADAELLGDWAERALGEIGVRGGIGIAAAYEGPDHTATPYVHVDLRGVRQRWRE